MSAYSIKLTNGHDLVLIQDGTADTVHSSLTLFGKNYAGYGQLLNENQVHMLENFSFNTPPANPLKGQLWWDSQNNSLKVYRNNWKVVSGPTAAAAEPVSDTLGDLWWDTSKNQLKAFNGTDWNLVGPTYATQQGVSGPVADTIDDVNGNSHTIVKFYIGGQVVGVLSKDLPYLTHSIPGFDNIFPGFTVPTTIGGYNGSSANSLALGGAPASSYIRSDVDNVASAKIGFRSNYGITVGPTDELSLSVDGNNINIESALSFRNMNFLVNTGVQYPALSINGTTGAVSVPLSPSTPTGVANKQYVDSTIGNYLTSYLRADGGTPLAGDITLSGTNLYSIGSPANQLSTVYTNQLYSTQATIGNGVFTVLDVLGPVSNSNSATTKQYVDAGDASLSATINSSVGAVTTDLRGNAPTSMNTLEKISASLNNDPQYYVNMMAKLNLLAPLNDPLLTGTPRAPTVSNVNDSTDTIATTAFVRSVLNQVTGSVNGSLAGYARLDSPQFVNIPTAPTAAMGDVSTHPTQLATLRYVEDKVAAVTSTAYAPINSPTFTGTVTTPTLTMTGPITAATANTFNIGSVTLPFNTVYAATFDGIASRAKYADLAECYVADAEYAPGTVLEFGGDKEVTLCDSNASTKVAGVVTTNPAYLMNSDCKGDHIAAIALQGRVPVMVTGFVQKGDLLVSFGQGIAKRALDPKPGTIIGKALESHMGDPSLIEVSIGRC